MNIQINGEQIELNKWLEEKDTRDFKQEIHLIAAKLGICKSRIEIDGEHPCGEDCIFIDGKWNGYLDTQFYWFIVDGYDPYGEYEDWVNRWREKNEFQESC